MDGDDPPLGGDEEEDGREKEKGETDGAGGEDDGEDGGIVAVIRVEGDVAAVAGGGHAERAGGRVVGQFVEKDERPVESGVELGEYFIHHAELYLDLVDAVG